MKISDANLKIIKDSRGNDTLETELKSGDFSVSASAPSGKSRGSHEAFVLEPNSALDKFEEIKPKILSHDFTSQEEFDGFLISIDGTPDKKNLGGNMILVLSLAFARLKAKNENLELFQYIQSIGQFPNYSITRLPHSIFNVINGGAHATNPKSKLEIQEFQIIPEVADFGLAYGLGQEFYRKLKEFLEAKFGKENVLLGDEAGFSCPFENDEQAIEIMAELISKHNYPLRIGLDAAATQMYQASDIKYQANGKQYAPEELKDFYLKLIETYDLISIEDPFQEEAFSDFAALTAATAAKGTKIITDDLTVTNPARLKSAIEKKSGNAILIKPNQIGTLTETLKVIKLAYENNWQTVISHRSGETMDDFIADLAIAVNAWGIKSGAPAAPERLAKYERILKIGNFIK